ncbi:serine/threonine-protein kinase [Streptomyces sp. NPDC047081]|uniref:serine/threonine-protein kinase n=1 Tax=Streptomyces sp. NPDC047081 TaxID=3154706 RepID=UPI0033F26FA6
MQGQLVAGRYRLADSIGSGGMGRVWRAHDEVLHRAVAIKELTAALYVSESDQERLLARTRAEARAAARINHSAVVTVHDVLEHDGRPWIVMELVEGYSLADAVKERGRVEPAEAARIGLWVLRALRAAHTAGVLHRDVKPGNVLIGHDGRVLLTDFGIAQIEGDTTITRTGEVVGSVDYLAPERVRGHDPGPASDLWALGATLYTAVEGRSPFRRTSPLSTMQAVVEEEAGEPRYAGPLGPVLGALLAKDPAERPDATQTEHMLAEAAEGRRSHSAQAYVPTQYGGSRYETGSASTGHTGTNGFGGTGTPYPPVTGPTAAGPTGMGGPGHPTSVSPAPAPAPKRRRLRTALLALALVVIVGGGGAVAYQQWDQSRDSDASGSGGTSASQSPTPSNSPTTNANGNVPADWKRYDDPWGFSVYLPKGWERKVLGVDGDLRQVDYTPDGGDHFVRIAIDTSPDFADAYSHQLNLEGQISQRFADYHKVRLEKNTYRDRPGAIWEYTFTQGQGADFPGPRRAVEETYMSAEGTEYAIYISSPAKDWATTSKQFKSVLQGWQEKTEQ